MIRNSLIITLVTLAMLTGCNAEETSAPGAGGLERQHIQTTVRDFLERDPNVPEYEIDVEEVAGDWARVTATPTGVEAEPEVFYLKKEVAGVVPTPAAAAPTVAVTELPQPPTTEPGAATRTAAETGWVIVLGPQTSFTEAELDEAGVPPEVRD